MNHQCVPRWDLDEEASPFAPSIQSLLFHHNNPQGLAAAVTKSADYDVAELTWKDGNPAMLGLRHHTRVGKPTPRYPSPAASAAGGTLECIVDQACGASSSPDLLSWAGRVRRPAAVDALVPCTDHPGDRKRPRLDGTKQGTATPANLASTVVNGESALVTMGTSELTAKVRTDDIGFSETPSASPTSAGDGENGGGSPETVNGSSAGTRQLAVDDRDFINHSLRSEQDAIREKGTTSISTKRSRVAAVHNQSERKRRDRINQKMKTLQKLLPNSNKADKASMLDEVIKYMKQLQAQVHMMSTIPPMVLPITMQQQQQQQQQQQFHISMMTRMSHMSMGRGMMNPSFLRGQGCAGFAPPPPMPHPSTFLPLQAAVAANGWDAPAIDWMQQPSRDMLAFMGCPTQQQASSTEAYSRMAALYQQLYGYNQKGSL